MPLVFTPVPNALRRPVLPAAESGTSVKRAVSEPLFREDVAAGEAVPTTSVSPTVVRILGRLLLLLAIIRG